MVMEMKPNIGTQDTASSISSSLEPNFGASETGSGSSWFDPTLNPPTAPEADSVTPQRKSSSTRPVFVLGCPRSGTTLLYHMLLSSGDFAGYPFESDTFRILG